MDGGNDKNLSNQEMLAEAIAFQKELNRSTDRRGGRNSTNMNSSGRGYGDMSSPMPGANGFGDRTSATPRGNSRQTVPQKLATPEQLFGLPSRRSTSGSGSTPKPVAQQAFTRPMDNFEPMQVDAHPSMPQEAHSDKTATQTTGRGLVGSRWATSGIPNTASNVNRVRGSVGIDVGTESHIPKKTSAWNNPSPASKTSNPVGASPAPAVIAKDITNADFAMGNAENPHSSSFKASLDTPEASNASKGLLSSRWASLASPSYSSPSTPQYPDPSTLKPVYRSEDWLADLSAEYKAMSIKNKDAVETLPAHTSSTTPSANAQTPAGTTKPQQSGQNTVDLSALPKTDTVVQPGGHPIASDAATRSQIFDKRSTGPTRGPAGFQKHLVQHQNSDASHSAEPSRTPASEPAVIDQPPAPTTNTAPGGIFNDSAFKDWYNSQFMRRKA